MAQAGMLGKLEYKESEHGWVLDVGGQLSYFYIPQSTLTDAHVPGVETAGKLVENINRNLSKRNIKSTVFDITTGDDGIRETVKELLKEMEYIYNSAHVACLLIGIANNLLHLALAAGPESAEKLKALARERMNDLDLRCEDLGIKGDALLDRMAQSDCNSQSIRRLFRNLKKKMIILSISADPRDAPSLRLGEEHRVLGEALQSSSLRDAYKLETLPSCRPQDIGPALRRHRPTIVHFSGHGSSKGLCFEDQNGNKQTVDIGQLANVLKLAKGYGLQGVVMNACYSETQAEAAANAVGRVIAMEGPVSDPGAITFTKAFYGGLGDGLTFDEAYKWALAEAGLDDATGPLKPSLITAQVISGSKYPAQYFGSLNPSPTPLLSSVLQEGLANLSVGNRKTRLHLAADRGHDADTDKDSLGNGQGPGRKETSSEEDTNALFRSLSFPEMDRRQNDVEDARGVNPGTYKWLDKHQVYLNWLEARSKLLWIEGKHGAGKSTLMKYLQEEGGTNGDIKASFFFSGGGSSMEKSPLGLYQTILFQLLKHAPQQLSMLAREYNERCKTRGKFGKKWNWHERELKNYLTDLLTLSERSIRVYVDGIDEGGTEVGLQIFEYFQGLVGTASAQKKSLSVCLSGRPYPNIANVQNEYTLHMVIDKENSADITQYVNNRFKKSFNVKTLQNWHLLRDKIVMKANGVFRWVTIVLPKVIDKLRARESQELIEKYLDEVPAELHNLYETYLREIPNDEREDSLRLMQLICYAVRPLSLQEMWFAMVTDAKATCSLRSEDMNLRVFAKSHEDMRLRIVYLSRGLAEVKQCESPDRNKQIEDQELIQFTHESVRDYLAPKGLQVLQGTTSVDATGQAQLNLALSCVRHLADFLKNCKSSHQSEEWPFLQYATTAWPHHAREAEMHGASLKRLLNYLEEPSNEIMRKWVELYQEYDQFSRKTPSKDMTLLHAAAKYNLPMMCKDLVRLGYEINAVDEFDQTPLSHAAWEGHIEIVDFLLEQENIQADHPNKKGRTPLARAATAGHRAIVEHLLGKKSVKVDPKDIEGRTPLSLASWEGHEEVVKLLLAQEGVDPNSENGSGQTPLSRATEQGRIEVVKLLLESPRIDLDAINHQDLKGCTPLFLAVCGGRVKMIAFLLDRSDVDPNLANKSGQTPLSKAVELGRTEVLNLLLKHPNTNVNLPDSSGQTPLHKAKKKGHARIVKMLLEHPDVKVNLPRMR